MEVLAECPEVGGPAALVTQAVQEEADLAQPEGLVEAPTQRDHLDVDPGVVGAEDLDADLAELPVPPGLGSLVTELRTLVPDLPGCRRVVLEEGSNHRSGELGSECDATSIPIVELVHLLGDHLGGIPEPEKHAQVLEDRRDDLAVAGAPTLGSEHFDQRPLAFRLRRQDVAGAPQRLEFGSGHGWPGYPADLVTMPSVDPPGSTR